MEGEKSMMIIDGHAHACGIYFHEKSIIEHMKKEKIDKVILSAGQTTYSKSKKKSGSNVYCSSFDRKRRI